MFQGIPDDLSHTHGLLTIRAFEVHDHAPQDGEPGDGAPAEHARWAAHAWIGSCSLAGLVGMALLGAFAYARRRGRINAEVQPELLSSDSFDPLCSLRDSSAQIASEGSDRRPLVS